MTAYKDASQLFNAFRNGETNRFSVYVEGVGGFFVSRSKDGIVFGSVDKRMKEAKDDHSTVLWDGYDKLKGFHRTVSDDEAVVNLKYDIDYVLSPNGIKKLLQDTSKKRETPLAMKVMLMLFYRALMLVFQRTWYKCVGVVGDSEARKLGLKPPCIYVKPKGIERVMFPIYARSLTMQNRILHHIHAKPTNRFRERRYVGNVVTKSPSKKKH